MSLYIHNTTRGLFVIASLNDLISLILIVGREYSFCGTLNMESNGHARVKRNDIIKENGNSHLSNVDDEHDPWTAWAYKPRTITLLLIGACFLM